MENIHVITIQARDYPLGIPPVNKLERISRRGYVCVEKEKENRKLENNFFWTETGEHQMK